MGCWGPFPAYFITAGVQKGALGEHQSIPESSANSELASFKMTCFVRWMYCLLECNSITIVNFFPAIFPIVYRARTPKLVAHHSNCLVLKILLLPLFSTPEFSMFMCMYVGGILATQCYHSNKCLEDFVKRLNYIIFCSN